MAWWRGCSLRTRLWALLVTIAINTVGVVLTMVKAHADPDSETLAAWVISALAAVTALSALGDLLVGARARPGVLRRGQRCCQHDDRARPAPPACDHDSA